MNATPAWWPKLNEIETINMAFANRMLSLSHELQCEFLIATRKLLGTQEELQLDWQSEGEWWNAGLSFLQSCERMQMQGQRLANSIHQVLADGIVEGVRCTQENGRLLQAQAAELRLRMQSMAPGTEGLPVLEQHSWLARFSQKSSENSRQTAELVQRTVVNAARRSAIA